MKFLDEMKAMFLPAANNLNQTIMSASVIVNHKLDLIHKAASDRGKPDIGDYTLPINFKKEVTEGETTEVATCPVNEIWAVQALVVDGVQEKSPAFILTIDRASMIASVIKEGVGLETIGGDIIVRRGQTISITPRTTGKVSLTIHVLRRMIPGPKHQDLTGEPGGLLEPYTTHETERDVIANPTGQWTENPPEQIEVGT